MGRHWHFFFAWLFVANGVAYVLYALASGHLRRDLLPTRTELRGIGGSVRDHLRFRHAHGEAARRYNVLQKKAARKALRKNRDMLRPVNLRLARQARIRWSGWLIASLLFLQLASAAYACSMAQAGAGAASMAGLPCAQQMADTLVPALDAEQPGLCLEHCKGGSQALDQGSPAPLPVPALAALYALPVAPMDLAERCTWQQAQRHSRGHAPPAPHSILHCCFRI